jgi:DNA-binding CsgD family transcriptional regulator
MSDMSVAAVDGASPSDRERYLALLTAVHARAVREHESAIALITAAAGHGKTDLLREFAQQVDGCGTILLRAAATRSERTLPFAVVEQLVDSHSLDAPIRGELRAKLDEIIAATPELAHDPSDFPIGAANSTPLRQLCRLLADLTANTSVVLLVDDVHDTDRPSLELLLYLDRRLRGLPLVQVLAECPEVSPAHPDLRARLEGGATDKIRLSTLDAEQVRSKLLDVADPDTAQRLSQDCVDISGGNPALVEALVNDHRMGRRWPGHALEAAVSGWVHLHDPTLIAVASVLATGVVVDRRLVAKVLGIGNDTADRALALLADTGPVRPGEPLHPAVAAALLRALPADQRARLHLDTAKALYDSGAGSEVVAAQLTAAGQAPDEWAFPVLWAAADAELAAGRLSTAVDHLQLALRGKATDRQRVRALVAFARIEWRNNPAGARRYFRRMVAAACEGHCDDRDLSAIIKYLVWHCEYADVERVLSYWCTAVAKKERPISDELRKTSQWMRFAHPGVLQRLGRVATIGLDERLAGTVRLLGIQALHGVLAGGPVQPWISDAEQILRQTRLSDPSLAVTLEPLQAAVLALALAGRLELAAARCEEMLAHIADLDAVTWHATASAMRAEIAVRRGESQVAIIHSRRALDLMRPESWGGMIGIPLSCLVIGLSLTGQHNEAAQVLTEPVPDAMFESRPGLLYLYGRAVSSFSLLRWHDALRDYERCGQLMREWGNDLPALLDWRTGAAQAQLHLGRPDLATALVREGLELPGADQGGVRGASLRVLAATMEQPKERLSLLSEAVHLLAGESGNRLELSHALLDLSQVHHMLGETSRARMLAEQASRQRSDSAVSLTAQVAQPGSVSAVASLSEAERRVATLAADSYTNREVADALFVTVSTVEQHLTRIYRKLNIKRRRELVHLLNEGEFDRGYPALRGGRDSVIV